MSLSPTAKSSPPRGFQFRLATLLIAMVWVGLICLGLRTPTRAWAGLIAVLTLLTVLANLLVLIYRTGPTRAMAAGYLLFCVGYFVHLVFLANYLSSAMDNGATTMGPMFRALFSSVHSAPVSPSPFSNTAVDQVNFISICHHALATLLGIAGAIAAHVLYAPRKTASPQDN